MTSRTADAVRRVALPAPVALPPADVPVMPDGTAPARFGDDKWDLAGAVTTPGMPDVIDWGSIASEPLRVAWKTLAFTRLRVPIGSLRVLKPESMWSLLAPARRAAELLESLGITRPSAITPAVGDAGIDMPGLNLRDVRRLPVPLAPLREQDAIVALLDQAERRIETVRTRVAEGLAAVNALEGNVLARAFRGKLVPHDPSDEPATAVLARVGAGPEAERRRREPSRRR